jgi:hypothetical protein
VTTRDSDLRDLSPTSAAPETMSSATTPAPATDLGPNRFTSIDQVVVGSVVWAYGRGYWRRARVVRPLRKRVSVSYYVQNADRPKRQAIELGNLRIHTPGSRYSVNLPAPPPEFTR